jgi:hypothetical protein
LPPAVIAVWCAHCVCGCSCWVRIRVSVSAIAFAHLSLVWFSHVQFPYRWVRCVWRVLLQHPGRSAVSVPRFASRVLVMHRSHFGSRYKLGCCGHAGLFSGAGVVVDSVMRAGVVCGVAPRAAAGGAQLARTHVSPFWVAPCVCMLCSVRVLWCGGLSAAFGLFNRRCGVVGSRSQAGCLKRNTAMDDSIGGS